MTTTNLLSNDSLFSITLASPDNKVSVVTYEGQFGQLNEEVPDIGTDKSVVLLVSGHPLAMQLAQYLKTYIDSCNSHGSVEIVDVKASIPRPEDRGKLFNKVFGGITSFKLQLPAK